MRNLCDGCYRQIESLYSDRSNVISPLEEMPPSSDEEDSEELDDEEMWGVG